MSTVSDLSTLDWMGNAELPDGFTPVDAIVLVKGYYVHEDGDMTRLVWAHKWTRALAGSPAEREGALRIATEMTLREAMKDYRFDDEDDE